MESPVAPAELTATEKREPATAPRIERELRKLPACAYRHSGIAV